MLHLIQRTAIYHAVEYLSTVFWETASKSGMKVESDSTPCYNADRNNDETKVIRMTEYDSSRVFGSNIKRLRLDARLTQAQLAELVGYADKSMIAKIEAGKTEPPYDKIRKFAEIFKLPVYEFYISEEDRREIEEHKKLSKTISQKECSSDLLQKPVIVPLLKANLGDTEFLFVKENIEQYIAAPDWLTCTFAITAPDDSMLNAGIRKGSTVFVEEEDPKNGELAAVIIGEDNRVHIRRIYVKDLYTLDALITLQTEHPDFPPEVFYEDGAEQVWILGKAVYVLNELK